MNIISNKRISNKNKINSNKPTLDVQHTQHLSQLLEMQSQKAELEEKKKALDTDIESISTSLHTVEEHAREGIIEKLLKLKDDQLQCISQIKSIEDKFNIKTYLTNTANILFQYYDVIDKGGQATTCPSPAKPVHQYSILKYFGKGGDSPAATISQPETKEMSRGALLDNYLKATCPEYIDPAQLNNQNTSDVCPHCKSPNLMTMVNDGYVLCNNCQTMEYIIIDHDKPSYRDPPKEISFYAYKRSNHLNEWLSQMQGKETTDIPEEVYDKILLEIRKQKITNMAQITPKKIREILRKLQINKYEHIPHIINRLTGKPMLQMPPELEEKLRNMFKQVQAPFLKHAPPTRKNFLSYSYCLHKMLQLLGKDEYLSAVGLLKSRDKLHIQDTIWKKICEELDWEFIPSI